MIWRGQGKARQGECTEGCSGQWLECAEEVLERNEINAQYFARYVLELLQKGRGKYRNIMIAGVENCGKTFLLKPLNTIFNTFSNPASARFAWVGAEKAEGIFLNDSEGGHLQLFSGTISCYYWKDN